MPSATTRYLDGFRSAMGLAFPPSYKPDDIVISTFSWQAIGADSTTINAQAASQTWPSANQARAIPFQVNDYYLVQKVWWMNGTTVGTDSADVGVYTEAGVKVVTGGGALTAGANILQEIDCTDTLLQPGRYWLAYAQNGVTATPFGLNPTTPVVRTWGCAQMAAAYVLPATFTPAIITASAVIPLCGIVSRLLAA